MDSRDPRALPHPKGGNRIKRAVYAVLGLAAAVVVVALGFFFLTVALIAGALLAGFVALRWWWMVRRIRKAQSAAGPLEGEFTVVERSEASRRVR